MWTFLLEEQAEGGEEVGACFDDEAKVVAISGIADKVLSFTVSHVCVASCVMDTGSGACDCCNPVTDSAMDWADGAFFTISNASCLAGEGGGCTNTQCGIGL